MDDRYLRLRRARPDLFANVVGGVEILATEEDALKASASANGPIGVIYADAYLTLVRDPVRFPDGSFGAYLRVLPPGDDHVPGVVVLPLIECQVVLIEHYRHATRAWHLETPRGFGVCGQSDEDSAARELREELGAEPSELLSLGRIHPDTGLLGQHATLWAARITETGRLDEAEAIRRSIRVSPEQAESMVLSGEITDAYTIAALTRARLAGLLGRPGN